jgi:hypothetical protein
MQNEGHNRSVGNSPVADSDETLEKTFFGLDYANRGHAPMTKRSVRALDNPTRTIVRDRVNAWGDQRFNENNSMVKTETFNIGEDEAQHSGDRNDWLREDNEDDGNQPMDEPSSRAASAAGSGTSLGDLKKGRDLVLAKLMLEKAAREEEAVELELAEIDAAVAIERRSRNSSQASSSAYSRSPSNASGPRAKSERKSNTGHERSRRRPLRDVLEAPEDLAFILPPDSRVATPFHSLNDSRNNAVANLDVPCAGLNALNNAYREATGSRQRTRSV